MTFNQCMCHWFGHGHGDDSRGNVCRNVADAPPLWGMREGGQGPPGFQLHFCVHCATLLLEDGGESRDGFGCYLYTPAVEP